MKVYVVTGYVPCDSAFRMCIATLDEPEADRYIEEHEPDPEMDNPEYGIEFHYRKNEVELGGLQCLWTNLMNKIS